MPTVRDVTIDNVTYTADVLYNLENAQPLWKATMSFMKNPDISIAEKNATLQKIVDVNKDMSDALHYWEAGEDCASHAIDTSNDKISASLKVIA